MAPLEKLAEMAEAVGTSSWPDGPVDFGLHHDCECGWLCGANRADTYEQAQWLHVVSDWCATPEEAIEQAWARYQNAKLPCEYVNWSFDNEGRRVRVDPPEDGEG